MDDERRSESGEEEAQIGDGSAAGGEPLGDPARDGGAQREGQEVADGRFGQDSDPGRTTGEDRQAGETDCQVQDRGQEAAERTEKDVYKRQRGR